MSATGGVQGALDVALGRSCSCPESHAGGKPCTEASQVATSAGGMCFECAQCYWLNMVPHEVVA